MSYHVKPNINGSALLAKKRAANPELSLLGSGSTTGRIEYGPLESVGQAVMETGYIISRTGEFFQRFAVGREDKCQLGGPVKIANMAGKAASQGFDWLIQLMAMLSVGIGLLNLFPLPPLDGGHLVFYAVEAIKGSPVSTAAQEIFYRIGFLLVMGFMGFVLFNDLFAC